MPEQNTNEPKKEHFGQFTIEETEATLASLIVSVGNGYTTKHSTPSLWDKEQERIFKATLRALMKCAFSLKLPPESIELALKMVNIRDAKALIVGAVKDLGDDYHKRQV